MTRHSSLTLSAAAIFAAAFGVAVPATPPAKAQVAAAPWQVSDDDAVLLQVAVGTYTLANEIRGYQTDTGTCLDLGDVIQSFDLPIRLDKKSRRATGWLFREDQKFTLDREAGTVQNVNDALSPLGNDIYDTPEGWCVNSKALSRWFGITLKPDLYNSVIRVESETRLPFLEALERKSRAARLRAKPTPFDLSAYPRADAEYRVWRTPSVDAVVRSTYTSVPGGKSQVDARYELYAAGEIAGAAFDARLSSDGSLQPDSLRVRAYRRDEAANLLGPLRATEVAAGDVQTQSGQLTGQTAVGRGAFITNQPVGRQSRFSTTTVRGTLPTGWDAELYRNGQLIAFQSDTASGRYEFFDIDLFYGRNDIEVVLYGPQGQIRRERFDHPVGQSNIEPGKTYYWAGILQQNRDLIELHKKDTQTADAWRGGLGLEHGLNDRTSIALGAQSLFLNGRRRNYLEGGVYRSMGAMQLELSGAHELGAGMAVQANALGRVGPVNFGAAATWTGGDFISEFVEEGLRHSFAVNFDTALRLGSLTLPLQASFGQATLRDGTNITKFLTQTAVSMRSIALTAQLERNVRDTADDQRDLRKTQLRLLANTRMFGLRLRGSAQFDLEGEDKGFSRAVVSTDKGLDDRSDISAEVEYDARSDDTQFSLGYSRRFDKFSLRTDARYSKNGGIGANLALSFSFGPDPLDGGIRFSEKKLARSGQAAVTVFRDDNGDGRRGPDEEVLKDVYVEAGFRTTDAITDENGRAFVDELRPFVPVMVGIDESSLGDPYLAASTKGIVVVPRPGVATVIELPVSPSGEVEGVIHSTSGVEAAGVALELIDSRGAIVASTVSEFDGFFLFERIPYGRYRIRVAADAARALGVIGQIQDAVELARDKDVARMGIIQLQKGSFTIAQAATMPSTGAISGLRSGAMASASPD